MPVLGLLDEGKGGGVMKKYEREKIIRDYFDVFGTEGFNG